MSQSSAPPQQGRGRPDSQAIQRLLDENAQLIQAIVENQNKGKAMGCLQYQQILHRNLMYLAGLVDPNLQSVLPPPMNFHQMSNQSPHLSANARLPNPGMAQVPGWSSTMPSQYDSTKTSYNQFSQSFPGQSSNPMQHQLDVEKRRQLLRIRQEQLIQAQQQQHVRGISDGQMRLQSAAQFSSLPSHLQQQPPPPYTTHSSVSAAAANENSSQNNN